MSNDSETPQPGGQFLVHQTQNGKLKNDVRFEPRKSPRKSLRQAR